VGRRFGTFEEHEVAIRADVAGRPTYRLGRVLTVAGLACLLAG
jgi:hypothetical protein